MSLKTWWRGRPARSVQIGQRKYHSEPEPGARDALLRFWKGNWYHLLKIAIAIVTAAVLVITIL